MSGLSTRNPSASGRSESQSNIPGIRKRIPRGRGHSTASRDSKNQLKVTTDLASGVNDVSALVTPTTNSSEIRDFGPGLWQHTPNAVEGRSVHTPRASGGIKSSGMRGGAKRVNREHQGGQTSTMCTPSPQRLETKISSASVRRALTQHATSDQSSSRLPGSNSSKRILWSGPKRVLRISGKIGTRSDTDGSPRNATIPSSSSVFRSTFSSRSKEIKHHKKYAGFSMKDDKQIQKDSSKADEGLEKEIAKISLTSDFERETSMLGDDSKLIGAIRRGVHERKKESQEQQNLLDECLLDESGSSNDLINSFDSGNLDVSRATCLSRKSDSESCDSISSQFLNSGTRLANVAIEASNSTGCGRVNPMARKLTHEDTEKVNK